MYVAAAWGGASTVDDDARVRAGAEDRTQVADELGVPVQVQGSLRAASGQKQPQRFVTGCDRSSPVTGRPGRRPWLPSRARCRLMHRRKDRCSFDHVLGPAVTVGSPVYFGNMVGEVKTFFDNWLLNRDLSPCKHRPLCAAES